MDTTAFVTTPDGEHLVDAGQPSLEGKDLLDVRDANGHAFVREYLETAARNGSGWDSPSRRSGGAIPPGLGCRAGGPHA